MISISRGPRSQMELHEASLHGNKQGICGKTAMNWYHGGLRYMFMGHQQLYGRALGSSMHRKRLRESQTTQDSVLYGIVFDAQFMKKLHKILDLLALEPSKTKIKSWSSTSVC